MRAAHCREIREWPGPLNLPNVITIARLLAVPVVAALIVSDAWVAAFAIFVAAGVSDAVDGYIAKRFDMRSELGAYLDPLADKALLVTIFCALAAASVVPIWLAILVVFRDVMIVAAVVLGQLLDRPLEIAPLPISKINTAVQICFAALILGTRAFGVDVGALTSVGIVAVAALTLASAAAYLAGWLRHMTP